MQCPLYGSAMVGTVVCTEVTDTHAVCPHSVCCPSRRNNHVSRPNHLKVQTGMSTKGERRLQLEEQCYTLTHVKVGCH